MALVLAIALASLAGFQTWAAAEPSAWDARVLWWRDARVYLATGDSVAATPGARLTFVARGRTIATGEVARVYEGELVLARLTSGSLRAAKRLDRVRVLAEPPPLPETPVLRLGLPARGRSSLLFACDRMSPRPPAGVRVEASSDRSWRLVRDSAGVAPRHWPDTLVVRLFDESADEEIALERGELDAAIFWPGELSTHMREHPIGRSALAGTRSRGVVTAEGLASEDTTALAALGRELFRGDLLPLEWRAAPAAGAARFEVDPAWPGRQAVERFLARGRTAAPGAGTRTVRLSFVDRPVAAASDSSAAPVFAVGCPVLCTPALRANVSAMGANALVDLIGCEPASRQP